jgi:hypothetical protein
MSKDFSISLEYDNVPTFGEYLLDQPEATENPSLDEATAPPPEPAATSPAVGKTPKASKSGKKPSNGTGSSVPQRDHAALVAAIKERLIDGDSDMAIAEDLSLGKAEYRRLKQKVYDQEADGFVGKSAEEQYVDYCLGQRKCLKELDDMIEHFSDTKQYNAMVGAVRAKSQIMDSMHKTGVSMGIVKQETSHDREVGGIRLSDLNNKELRDQLANELRGLQHIIDKFGDKPMAEVAAPSPMADPAVVRQKQ